VLGNLGEDDVMELNIPTGVPLVYEFDDSLRVLTHYYLADEKDLARRVDAVVKQTAA